MSLTITTRSWTEARNETTRFVPGNSGEQELVVTEDLDGIIWWSVTVDRLSPLPVGEQRPG
jgi:hypothetical protein